MDNGKEKRNPLHISQLQNKKDRQRYVRNILKEHRLMEHQKHKAAVEWYQNRYKDIVAHLLHIISNSTNIKVIARQVVPNLYQHNPDTDYREIEIECQKQCDLTLSKYLIYSWVNRIHTKFEEGKLTKEEIRRFLDAAKQIYDHINPKRLNPTLKNNIDTTLAYFKILGKGVDKKINVRG